jgi:hypothetical protein
MEDNKKAAIEKILLLSKQDKEFNEELRKRLDITPVANSAIMDDERLNQIYEYCIEKIIQNQAEEFYKDFPIPTLIPTLVKDYVRMESFRRKDSFGDFCLALYQQIECVTNKICESATLSEITDKMWAYEAYIKSTDGKDPDIKERTGTYRIADLIFPFNNKNGVSNAVEKSLKTLQNQYAIDKIRIIVYYFGYGAKMKSSDFDSYKEITGLLNDIYQCRNTNHRGNTLTEYETETLNRILPMKSFYYFKFLGALAQYIDFIKTGSLTITDIAAYAKTLPSKKVETKGPKVVGKIDLKDDGKKRFK